MTDEETCEHHWIIDRYLGAKTGDEVCTKCGEARWRKRPGESVTDRS